MIYDYMLADTDNMLICFYTEFHTVMNFVIVSTFSHVHYLL